MFFCFPFDYTIVPPLVSHAESNKDTFSYEEIVLLNDQCEHLKEYDSDCYINKVLLELCDNSNANIQKFWMGQILRYNIPYLNWITDKSSTWNWWHGSKHVDRQMIVHTLEKTKIIDDYSRYFSNTLLANLGSKKHIDNSLEMLQESSTPVWIKNICAFIIAPLIDTSSLSILKNYIDQDKYMIIMSILGDSNCVEKIVYRMEESVYHYLLSHSLCSKFNFQFHLQVMPEFEEKLSQKEYASIVSFCSFIVYPEMFIKYCNNDPWILHTLKRTNLRFKHRRVKWGVGD